MICNICCNETINLYGRLARLFEKKYNHCAKNINISVTSTKEFMQAMEANFPGFRLLVKSSGVVYRLVRGSSYTNGRGVSSEEAEMDFGNNSWHLMVVAKAFGGVFKVILGVILFAVGAYFGQTWLMKIGIGLALSGVAQMLTPNPGLGNYGDNEKPDEKPSYLFDGPRNTVEPGTTIPRLYGSGYVGSITVSGGVRVTNVI